MASVGTITYAGDLVKDQIGTSPWDIHAVMFPDHGSAPFLPQMMLEVLEPKNVDGARYRTTGTHWVKFIARSITPAADFESACRIAREMEICRGDKITLFVTMGSFKKTYRCYVIDCSAEANAKRILGAVSRPVGQTNYPNGQDVTTAAFCVDATWSLQCYSTTVS